MVIKKHSILTFTQKARLLHGDKYDYSKVNYINNYTKIIIICHKHGEFEQRPMGHLRGRGCSKCANENCSTRKLFNEEDFLKKIKVKHGNKYDYSKVEYTGTANKIIIICPKHGEFKQKAANHLRGDGCPKCAVEINSKKSTYKVEGFIEKAKIKHGDRYDYSKVEYINSITKVIIICPKHGEFEQVPAGHLHGAACPKCAVEINADKCRRGIEEYIREAKAKHGDKYDYSKLGEYKSIKDVGIIIDENGFEHYQRLETHLICDELTVRSAIDKTNYIIFKLKKKHGNKYDYSEVNFDGTKTKIPIICHKHGRFEQEYTSHLLGAGCPKCSSEINGYKSRLTTDEFINNAKKVHSNKYDYSKVEYFKNDRKVTIICPKHGEFRQTPASHMKGGGCPKCCESRGETKIRLFLEKEKIHYIPQKKFDGCRNKHKLPFDFYLPDINLCVEYDGVQHFQHVKCFGDEINYYKQRMRDKIKRDFCKKNNIRLIRIKYNEDINKKLSQIKIFTKLLG
jgi:hypothetical protein